MRCFDRCLLAFMAALGVLLATAPAQADPRERCLRPGLLNPADIQACTELIRLNPRDSEAYKARASAHAYFAHQDVKTKSKYTSLAIADYTEAIRINPRDAAAYAWRGELFHTLRADHDTAIVDYSFAIQLSPTHDPLLAHYYASRSKIYAEGKGDYDRAIADYSEVVRLNKSGYGARAGLYEKKGDYDRAFADYTEAIRLDRFDSDYYYRKRGDLYARKGSHDSAIADYTTAISLGGFTIVAYVARGQAWEAKGHRANAIEDYNNAIEVYNKALALVGTVRQDERDAQAVARTRLAALQAASQASAPEPKAPTAAPVTAGPPSIKLGRRVALVIGNAAYVKWSALLNPGKDAAAVAAALEKQLGFDKVILKLDLTEKGFKAALIEFAQVAAGADVGLIYYAGHGMEAGGRNFLIPVDAEPPTPANLDLYAIPLDAVTRRLDGVGRLKLVVLDACRSNPFDRGGRGLAAVEPDDNTLVVYAAKHGTTASDGPGLGHSPFTQAFLQHVTKPGVEVRQLFGYVRDETLKLTKRAQQPWTYGTLGGDPLYLHVKQ